VTPHEVIVQLMGNTFGTGDEWARDILGAFEAAGYAVVKLPEWRMEGGEPYIYGYSTNYRVRDGLIITTDGHGTQRTPTAARVEAASLLAAAAAVGVGEQPQ
jgi:hypothetical protein